ALKKFHVTQGLFHDSTSGVSPRYLEGYIIVVGTIPRCYKNPINILSIIADLSDSQILIFILLKKSIIQASIILTDVYLY
ncbi:MAG: hypothetical protein KAJ33_01260, partial [Thermoplasmata archaeon]|nr:hypothetical protein [Thermoplasmata archaeon]